MLNSTQKNTRKMDNVRTKNAIIKLYQENEITYDEAVSQIHEYKKK